MAKNGGDTDSAASSAQTGKKSASAHKASVAPGAYHEAAMYAITRCSSGTGWQVHLKRGGVLLHKTFFFSMNGGREAALVRAQAWRDEMVRTHLPSSRRQTAEIRRRNNKSGIPGVVCRVDAQGAPTGWIAQTYLGPGNYVSKFFRVGRFGAAEAKRLAIAERQKQLQQMEGLRQIHPAEALVRAAPSRAHGPLPDCVERAAILMTTNSSGFPGVALLCDKNGRPNRWRATSSVGGRTLRASFSLKIHGYEQARALAIAARNEHLQERARLRAAKPPAQSR